MSLNPGSFKEWAERNGVDPSKPITSEYQNELDRFRQALATEKGVSLEDLHEHFASIVPELVGSLISVDETDSFSL